MKLFKLRYLITVPVVAVVLVLFLAPLVLSTAPLLGVRQQVATSILTRLLERDVQVLGEVDIAFGAVTRVRVDGTEIGALVKYQTTYREHIDHLEFSFPLLKSLTQGFEVLSINLEGVDIELNASGDPQAVQSGAKGGKDAAEDLAGVPEWFLSNPAAENMVLRDLTINFRDDDAGWNETLVIKEAHSSVSEDGGRIFITAAGTLNRVPLSLSGDFPNPRRSGGQEGPFQMGVEVAGATSRVAGNIDLSSRIAVIDAELDDSSSVVSAVLNMFGIVADFDAASTTKAKLSGPLNRIEATEIAFALNITDGYKVKIEGRIENLVEMHGINLEIDGRAPEKLPVKPEDATFLDFDVVGFKGLVTGDIDAITVKRLNVFSTSLSAELKGIGPISVERVAKGQNGELRIEGIHVLNGPPERRTLDLKGHVLDLLNLSGILLEGTIDMPGASALSFEGSGAEAALGRLTGDIAITGINGDFSIDRLHAQITESDLLKMALKLADREASQANEVTVDTDLEISDLTAFAAALDQNIGKVGKVSFRGTVTLSELVPSLIGVLSVEATRLDIGLRGSLEDGVPRLDGSVKSASLHLDDVGGLVSLFRIASKRDVDRIDFSDAFVDAIRARIDIDFARIAGGVAAGKSAGQVKATVDYRHGVVLVDPLNVNFLNGKITASLRSETRKEPVKHTLKGKVSRLNLGSLSRQMQVQRLVSGSLNLNFNVAMAGNTAPRALKSASGSVTGSIWGGVLETDLLDLSGLNLVSWLMSSSKAKGRAELVCAVLPFQLKNGRGSTRSMIIETKHVQAVGAGGIDIRKERVNLKFQPRPKVKQLVDTVSPFTVTGSLKAPKIKLEKGGAAGRVVGETLTLPLNLLGAIFTGNKDKAPNHRPCVLQRKKQPKGKRGKRPRR
ncbi:MAG: AsmA-like C-terminal region-containing protein [Hyphomicrobiales bacterium]